MTAAVPQAAAAVVAVVVVVAVVEAEREPARGPEDCLPGSVTIRHLHIRSDGSKARQPSQCAPDLKNWS